jgi:hypothetical protein
VTPSPATAGRPRFDIADIVRRHRAKLEAETRLAPAQRRVLSAIALCRTAALGGHVDCCRACGYEHPAYNSCRNRHCPKCQALAQERWITARSERLLPTGHFHVVFTLPSELRSLAKCRPAESFDALFRAAADTLLELGHSRFGATLGVTMVLHTWTRELGFHPHVHAIVSAGGLALDRSHWTASSRKYLFPVEVMGALLRGKMMAWLRRLHADGALEGLQLLADSQAFDRLMARLARTSWIVYAKKPFRRSDHVLAYLGRYTHRVGIANSRIVAITDDAVTFRTKAGKIVTVSPVEFLRRLVQHVLPSGLQKIRHYGLYAGSHLHDLLATARGLLSPPAPNKQPPSSASTPLTCSLLLLAITGRDIDLCPRCGHRLEHLPLAATARAPPPRALA